MNSRSSINLPPYLYFFEERSRVRFSHLDKLPVTSDIVPVRRALSNNINCSSSALFVSLIILIISEGWCILPINVQNGISELVL